MRVASKIFISLPAIVQVISDGSLVMNPLLNPQQGKLVCPRIGSHFFPLSWKSNQLPKTISLPLAVMRRVFWQL